MTFSTKTLVGDRVLVTGTDQFNVDGKVVLDGAQWAELNAHDKVKAATEAFDAKVEEFFKDLTDAAEELEKAGERKEDEISYVVVQPGVDHVAGTREIRVRLTHDSQVLRLLSEGKHDRLMWVDNTLEILAP